jgi:hypothetical protein
MERQIDQRFIEGVRGRRYHGYDDQDIIGMKRGKLTIIRLSSESNLKKGKRIYECVCDCGKKRFVRRELLVGKRIPTTSCGCIRFKLPPGDGTRNALFVHYRIGAKKRGLSFSLNKDEFFVLSMSRCHYCGAEPLAEYYNSSKKTKQRLCIYNGIDRVDNSKGYEIKNCVPCCKVCNMAKRLMSRNEFLEWVRKVYLYNYGGNGTTKS